MGHCSLLKGMNHQIKLTDCKISEGGYSVLGQSPPERCLLLKLTDIPIGQLAIKYNFGNFSFLCQFVKAHLGLTPQEYRESGAKSKK